jgi:hypothetical protein
MAAAILQQVCGVAPADTETAGAGKSSMLEGTRGRETWGTTDGDGLVHLAVDELFGLVHGKAVTVGKRLCGSSSTLFGGQKLESRCGCGLGFSGMMGLLLAGWCKLLIRDDSTVKLNNSKLSM